MPKVSIRDPEPYQRRRRFEVQTRHNASTAGRNAGRQDSCTRRQTTKGHTVKPITINPGIHNSRQNISLAIKSKQTWRFNFLIGCTVEDFRWHLERQFSDGMRWQNYGDWRVEHILSCNSFPINDPGARFECHHWSNLIPVWREAGPVPENCELLASPDYDTLLHFTPRATIIASRGIPELASGFNLSDVASVDRVFSRTKTAIYSLTYKGHDPSEFSGNLTSQGEKDTVPRKQLQTNNIQ